MSIASEVLSIGFLTQTSVSGSELRLPSVSLQVLAGDDTEVTADDLAGDGRPRIRIQMLRPLPTELARGNPSQVKAELDGTRISITKVIDNPAKHYVELIAIRP